MRFRLLFIVCIVVVSTLGYAPPTRADDSTTDKSAGFVGSDATLDNTPVPALCNSRNITVKQLEFREKNKHLCDEFKVKNAFGFASQGLYGWGHPVPAYCNMGTGFKGALPGFIYGTSAGSKNFVVLIGAALSALFAGCNNNPEPTAPSPAPSTSPPPISAFVTSDVLTPSESITLTVYEASYKGHFFVVSGNPDAVTVSSDTKNPGATIGVAKTPGEPVSFTLSVSKNPVATTVNVVDEGGGKAAVPLVMPTPTATPTKAPSHM